MDLSGQLEFSIEELKRETFLGSKDSIFYKFYKIHQQSHWIAEEIDLTRDLQSFNSLPTEEQAFIKKISTFFLISDAIVCDNVELIACCTSSRDIKAFYASQNEIENTHIEAYGNIFSTVFQCSDPQSAIEEIIKMPSVIEKRKFCFRFQDEQSSSCDAVPSATSAQLQQARLVLANTFIEGVFFAASFSGILWLKKRGECPGIVKTNEWIARDERLHWRFGCELFKERFSNVLSLSEIYDLVEEVYKIEASFVDDILVNGDLGEITQEALTTYVKYCCNEILEYIGVEPYFKNVSQPFEFMNFLNYPVKPNFFETRVTNYSLPSSHKKFVYTTNDKFNYKPLV